MQSERVVTRHAFGPLHPLNRQNRIYIFNYKQIKN